MVEFVYYDSEAFNRCSGTLVLCIDDDIVMFPKNCMRSGGNVWFDDDGNEHISYGPWTVKVPEQYKHLTEEIEACVNEHVEWGCCGGCI